MSSDQTQHQPVGRFRWVICALLFAATTINYADRIVITVLEPTLKQVFQWTPSEWGRIMAAFTLPYAIGVAVSGWLLDKFGARVLYAGGLILWSLAAASHSLASTALAFAAARFFLGVGESVNFPAAIRTAAEWFPKRERALVAGFINAGSNVGALLAPAVVPIIALHFGWQAAFLLVGLIGLIWVLFWWPLYRPPHEHPRLSPAELAYIQSDPADPPVSIPWGRLLQHRQTWGIALAKAFTDCVWWFVLFWFPLFMERFDINLKTIGAPMIAIYLLADLGSIAGGWHSSWLIGRRGWSINGARKFAMLCCALTVVPVIAVPFVDYKWIAVLLTGMTLAAHQGFSSNLFTLASDIFPRRTVGSVVGIANFAGASAAFLMNLTAGVVREMTGSYVIIFSLAAFAYLAALLIIQLFIPRVEPVRVPEAPA